MSKKNFILDIKIEENVSACVTPRMEHERQLAIYDLLQNNNFSLPEIAKRKTPKGPYKLTLSIEASRLIFAVLGINSVKPYEFHLSLTPLRPVIRDYFEICKSYFDAVKRLPPSQIEAVDMGRRGIHLEGGRILMERLEGKIHTDLKTAKRLFTLICALKTNGSI